MPMFKMLDLFSGIGGFSYAASQFGIKTVGFSEIDSFCTTVLKKHWPHVTNYGDIKNLQWREHVDLITGGFPCQPFSIAGKRKGKNDERYLWPEFLRIIKQCKPTWIIAENVVGIVAMELDDICDDLEAEGYKTWAFIIPACAAGAPHRRNRVWVIANRDGERCNVRPNNRQKRLLQNRFDRHIAAIQQEWQKFKPESWATFNAQKWLESSTNTQAFTCRKNNTPSKLFSSEQEAWMELSGKSTSDKTGIYRKKNQPPVPGMDDGIPDLVDRNKALGNSIVPQIAFVLIGIIFHLEKQNR